MAQCQRRWGEDIGWRRRVALAGQDVEHDIGGMNAMSGGFHRGQSVCQHRIEDIDHLSIAIGGNHGTNFSSKRFESSLIITPGKQLGLRQARCDCGQAIEKSPDASSSERATIVNAASTGGHPRQLMRV
jgi:hypothetical protein